MTAQHVSLVRILLGALVLGTLMAQLVVIPRVAAGFAETYPQVAHLETPYVVAFVAALGGVHVALLAAWQLLTTTKTGGVVTSHSKRWANTLALSLALMAVICVGVFAHTSFVESVGGPPVFLGLLVALALIPGAFVVRSKAMDFSLGDAGHRVPVQTTA